MGLTKFSEVTKTWGVWLNFHEERNSAAWEAGNLA